ncbi:hypothetical protein Hanom_Chr17g01584551 [Helianthus anomalus]
MIYFMYISKLYTTLHDLEPSISLVFYYLIPTNAYKNWRTSSSHGVPSDETSSAPGSHADGFSLESLLSVHSCKTCGVELGGEDGGVTTVWLTGGGDGGGTLRSGSVPDVPEVEASS